MAEQRERERRDELTNRLVGHLEQRMIRELARKLIRPLVEAATVRSELRDRALTEAEPCTTADDLADRFKMAPEDVRDLLEPMVGSDHLLLTEGGHYLLVMANGDDGDLAPEELLDHIPEILVGWPKDKVSTICAALSAGGMGSGEE